MNSAVAVALSPDGRQVVTASVDNTARVIENDATGDIETSGVFDPGTDGLYLVDHPIRLVMGVEFVGTRTAPTVEERTAAAALINEVSDRLASTFAEPALA